MVYYNDNDPKICEWLRALIRAELIPKGDVDERDVQEVEPKDVAGYQQCHFFAGIGGWPYALRLAGWPEDRAVWTASLPCQPFSCAGRGLAERDERHLWPAFRWLLAECGPAICFGEQVASKTGRHWLTGVRADLETLGYAVGAADLPAACVGAPHIRQRLFWVANADRWRGTRGRVKPQSAPRMARNTSRGSRPRYTCWNESRWVTDAFGIARRFPDGFKRMADGISGGVATLSGFGNSIVPQLAAEFIAAYMDTQRSNNVLDENTAAATP